MVIELTNAKEVQKSFEREARTNTLAGEVVKALKTEIQPVLNINPQREIKFVSINKTTTGTATQSISSTKRTFLVGVTLSACADSAADNTVIYCDCIQKGKDSAQYVLLNLRKITLTAFQDSLSISFPPLELKKGSSLRVSNTFSVGASTATAVFYYYEIDE